MDIIEFGWHDSYAVDPSFDLNDLRRFIPVKEERNKYIPVDEDIGHIRVLINKKVVFEEKEIEEAKLEKAEADKEQYSRWWREEQTKTKKLEEELNRLKLDLEKMKKGE